MRKKLNKYRNKRKLTWDDVRIPKSYTPTSFNLHINSIIDKIDFGQKKGHRKSHNLINRYLANKHHQSTSNITLGVNKKNLYVFRNPQPHQEYEYSLEQHLNGDGYIYYCSRGDSFIHLITQDFDPKDDTNNSEQLHNDIASTVMEQRSIYNSDYYDTGSSGHSLNYPLKINTESLAWYCMEYTNLSFPQLCKKVYNAMSRCMRMVYNNPTPFSVPSTLKFDALKGTPSEYDYFDYNGSRYYKSIIHSGTFAKLPCPITPAEFDAFYNMPLVDITTLISYVVYISSASSWSLSKLYTSAIQSNDKSALRSFSLFTKAYNFLSQVSSVTSALPPLGEDASLLKPQVVKTTQDTPSYTPTTLSPSPSLSTSTSLSINTNALPGNNPPKNRDIEEHNGIIVSKIENTGSGREHDIGDEILYDSELLTAILSTIDLKELCCSFGKTYGDVRVDEIDIAIGMKYIWATSMGGAGRHKTDGKEFTICTDTMGPYTQKLVKKGVIQAWRAWANPKKSRLIRHILEHLRWIERFSDNWTVGISKRWGIGKAYHKYQEWENKVEPANINKAKAKGLGSLEDWSNMGNAG